MQVQCPALSLAHVQAADYIADIFLPIISFLLLASLPPLTPAPYPVRRDYTCDFRGVKGREPGK